MLDARILDENLARFTGSEEFFRHWTRKVIYTEGVRYLAEAAQCHWLLDCIVMHQSNPAVRVEDFQAWKLSVQRVPDVAFCPALLSCEDGNGNEVFRVGIPATDFPKDGIELWCLPNELGLRTVLLPSEY